MAHELGHAFGLHHDFRDDAYIMSYGWTPDQLSACAAEFLSVHPYFNPDSPIHGTLPPTVELISPRAYPAGSESVSIRLKVGDSEGLHQVFLFAPTRGEFGINTLEVKACRGLSGERDTLVEFDYDGSIPSSFVSSLSDPIAHPIEIRVVDTEGDVGETEFVLVEISPYHIATLEGHTDGVWAMAVSPDGGILASGAGTADKSRDTTVRLWNVASREEIATLEGHTDGVWAMAFSRNGALLASGSRDGTILLWDVVSRTKVGSLKGHTNWVRSVAFSPDGALLASGSRDGAELWDVASRTKVSSLSIDAVHSVAFSPDGALLATGSSDGAELWDVASRTKVGSLTMDKVRSMAFSPDGALLATGMSDDTVRLLDVASRAQIGILEEHTKNVTSVAFSPDGTLLASGSKDGRVILWDVLRRQKLVVFPNTGEVRSVVFLGDDATLASGSGLPGGAPGMIALWDVSEWMGSRPHTVVETSGDEQQESRPHTLRKLSGDNQQGLAGEQLATPFVVSVLDEDGTAIAGAVVTFSVTAGGGTLSAATATTNTSGQARSTLTLGSEPGTNTVAATVAGLEPETFTATAIEQTPHSLTKVSGDSQEGPASTKLATPFVVSVLDQASSPLAGATVTFSVTAGGGLLSSTTDADPCTIESSTSSTTATTDANGQAATRLTLGSEPGTNTVSATVEGLEPVTFTATAAEQAMPHSLAKVCGDSQEGTAGILLDEPFVVLVSDEEGTAMAGVVVSFTVTAGGGTLSAATATTNANGRAATRLTLGSEPGTNAVSAIVEGLEPGTFTATGQESPLVSLFDAFLGGGKRVALPDNPQLAQNAPNPFNSQTVLAYFLHAPSPASVEVFALTGQRVAVLQQGLQQAGYHRLHWNGRDDAGRPVASGMYLYRLMTEETVLTRKLILLR